MANIFISHSARDRDVAHWLATFLEGQGWTVWWDKSTLGGRELHDVSMAELGKAQLVIVIWSTSSVGAAEVLEEAVAARDACKVLHLANAEARPKQVPVRRRDEPLLEADDHLQISLAVLSFMRARGLRPTPGQGG